MTTLASFALYPLDPWTTTLLVCVAVWAIIRAINRASDRTSDGHKRTSGAQQSASTDIGTSAQAEERKRPDGGNGRA